MADNAMETSGSTDDGSAAAVAVRKRKIKIGSSSSVAKSLLLLFRLIPSPPSPLLHLFILVKNCKTFQNLTSVQFGRSTIHLCCNSSHFPA